MLDILRDHLSQAATPELLAVIEAAHDVFERIGLEDYEQGFEELLMTGEDEVASDVDPVMAISALTDEILRKILREHGVMASEEANTVFLTTLVTAILDLQDWEDLDTIERICTLDGPPEEIFGELVALVSQENVDEVMTMLVTVDQFLITRMKELTVRPDPVSDYAERTEQARGYILKLQALFRLVGTNKLKTARLLTEGFTVGLPFMVYADVLGREFETLTVDKAAAELLAMALISSDGSENPRSVITQNIEHLISNIDQVTRVDVAIGDLLLRLSQL